MRGRRCQKKSVLTTNHKATYINLDRGRHEMLSHEDVILEILHAWHVATMPFDCTLSVHEESNSVFYVCNATDLTLKSHQRMRGDGRGR